MLRQPVSPGLSIVICCLTTKTLVSLVALDDPCTVKSHFFCEPLDLPVRSHQERILYFVDYLQPTLARTVSISRAALLRETRALVIIRSGAEPTWPNDYLAALFTDAGWSNDVHHFLTEVDAVGHCLPDETSLAIVSSGTGCTVALRDIYGKYHYSGGCVFPLDHHGGGYYVGADLLLRLAAVHQGTSLEAEDLAAAMLAAHDCDNYLSLIDSVIYPSAIKTRRAVAELAVLVNVHAENGNPTAHDIIRRAAGDTAGKLVKLADRLQPPAPLNLVAIGGLARSSALYRHALLDSLTAQSWPCTPIDGSALVELGGILTAFDRLGVAPPCSTEDLRRQLVDQPARPLHLAAATG